MCAQPTDQRRRLAAALSTAAALLVLAAGAVWLCPPGAGGCVVPAIDRAGLAAFDAMRGPLLDRFFAAATWLGSLWLLLPAALAVAWHDAARAAEAKKTAATAAGAGRRIADAAFVAIALVGVAALARLAKIAVDRPRPDLFPALTAMPGDASYPSAHTMQVVAFALAWLLRPGARRRPVDAAVAAALAAVAVTVAASRLYLQVHFPSDVVAGAVAAAGFVVALSCLPVWPRRGA